MNFENVIGNQKIKILLTNTVQSNNLLHSYLFTGVDGIGKSIFAREFAKMILCTSSKQKPCDTCKSCIEFQGNSHPDFLQIDPEEGKTIKIEQIRYLQEKIAEKPITSDKKVYIINDCDTMTREASNSLLKTLEEPPSYAILILITANESKLLATIKSRCTKIAFSPLNEEEIKNFLTSKQLQEDVTDNMIKQCEGSIGKALKIQEEKDLYIEVEKVLKNIETEDITSVWKQAEVLYQAKEKINSLLDYMNIIFYEKLHTNQNIKCIKAVSIVEEAKKRINSNANYDMTIDNLLLKLWEEFH